MLSVHFQALGIKARPGNQLASVVKNVLSNKAVGQHQRGAAQGIAMTAMSLFEAAGLAGGGASFSWAEKCQLAFYFRGLDFDSTAESCNSRENIVCRCLKRAELFTSHTSKNPYRRFYGCSDYKTDGCGFFKWVDPELPSHVQAYIIKFREDAKNQEDIFEKLKKKVQTREMQLAGGGMTVKQKPKPVDEQLVYQVALQDLSQPKSEALPPEGSLSVSLLKHQRIALAWMIRKETEGFHCSGGILADEQGLGKTISTISLILSQRPFLCSSKRQKLEVKTVIDLDDEDNHDEVAESFRGRFVRLNQKRQAAGTLVVCPTSVLRQWANELQSKVSKEVNLSVLVYHGSSRTKDPNELARYDVVLTTYAIVGMEVPKQSADKDDNSDKRGNKKNAGPLSEVGWFRVVLDEAQTIKNRRTQMARSCWGLRAKRRWCLSGTPIQNTIEDLYSYFRFLKYDPYSEYRTFFARIKLPIEICPAAGYKKLQAVLQTVMLRRTKATLLDGKPIINLPPKTIELREVDFSAAERNFYTYLETGSMIHYREYAAAETVQENYVNLLVMLLRLRQACDHPALVSESESNLTWISSVETMKKLSPETQLFLMEKLAGSSALCSICNDPPEDAVVSICGHVFCNQCISQHLTAGDEKSCPHRGCRSQLNDASVFSRAALSRIRIGDDDHQSVHPPQESQLVEADYRKTSSFDGWSIYSSKIMAALEVLQSLNQSFPASNEVTNICISPVNSSVPDGAAAAAKSKPEKAIVFSQWTKMLDLFEACIRHSCPTINFRRLDGTMSVAARDQAVKDFNTNPEVTVIIMSLKAASLGLNMVAASHVIMLDLWWNPTTEDQAIDRAHRIGQTRPVKVVRLTVKDTVEERILALQEKKREMAASAFGEDGTGSLQTRLTVEDVRFLFERT